MKRFLLILSAFLLLFSATTHAENSSFTPNKAIVITEVEGTTATIKFSKKLATTLTKPSTLKSIADAARKKITKAGRTGIKAVDDFLALTPKIDNLTTSTLPKGYEIFTRNGRKYIRRVKASDVNTPRLMVDETGTIVSYTKPTRMSSNGKLRTALQKANGGEIPANHQAHHLVPDNVVKNSPIHQEAIQRGIYDIDRVSNGKLLAESGEDFSSISQKYPSHFGSHPNYDKAVTDFMSDVIDGSSINIKNLGKLSNKQLLDLIDDVEDGALDILTNWNKSKLK